MVLKKIHQVIDTVSISILTARCQFKSVTFIFGPTYLYTSTIHEYRLQSTTCSTLLIQTRIAELDRDVGLLFNVVSS